MYKSLFFLLIFFTSQTSAVTLPIASLLPSQKITGLNQIILGNIKINQIFAFSLWVNPPDKNPDWADIFDYRHKGDKSFAFHQKESNLNLYAFGVHSKNEAFGVYAKLKPNVWQHIYISKNNKFIQIFVDGKLIDKKEINDQFKINYTGDETLTIGNWGYGERNWLGKVSCFRIFNKDLPQVEISNLSKEIACTEN